MVTTKRCGACRRQLPVDRFGKASSRGDGLHGYCRSCANLKVREWQRANPEKTRAIGARAKRKMLYGLDQETYAKLKQVCAICGVTETLGVDHCHVSGVVRGLLCRKCNVGLGMFDDNPILLVKALTYLGASDGG